MSEAEQSREPQRESAEEPKERKEPTSQELGAGSGKQSAEGAERDADSGSGGGAGGEAEGVAAPGAEAGAGAKAGAGSKADAGSGGDPERGSGVRSEAGAGAEKTGGKSGGAAGPVSAKAADSGSAGGVASGAGAGAGRGAGQGAVKAGAAGRSSGPETDGRLLAGRYRLGGVLGRGGMGTVWRAVDETLGRTVAVKELRFPNSIDEEEKRRLITRTLREAKAIARIRNTSAVTVYDVVDEDDRPWIVMELVEGKSLAEAVREDGTLTPRRAAEVGLAILDVLRSAHREGILHRDVKPSNVLIAEDGRVVLTDFGIAQVEGDPSITSTGMLVGAPSYISPERARGHKPGPAADLWSLGGLLYASVEGSPPYDKGSAIATLTAVMTEPLDPPKNAGPLEEVIYGLLVKDPDQRLDDAGARALLTNVLYAPEEPERPVEPEPAPDATRAIPLPPLPPAPPQAKPKDPAADRVRAALRSVRNAAAAAKPEPKPRPASQTPAARPAPVRAPLTDVVPRRTLVIIAIVAALAVLTTVLFLTLGDNDKGSQGKTKDDKTASAGAANGGSGKDTGAGPDKGKDTGTDDSANGSGGSGGSAGSGQPSGGPKTNEPAAGGDGMPAGYALVSNDQFHFTMAMPKGFKLTGIAGQNSGGIFSGNGGFPRIQVDFNGSPRDDAAAAWTAAVAGTRASSSGYKHLGIRKVAYNGYPTVADWQFERNQGGQRVRVLNRGFKVDAERGYSIMITCKASEWQSTECETLRKTAFATFKPKD
ncbi:serine/threonine-protein kinase [Streptomyces sp. NPDC002870]|uniref:serine/threonine-protein kinase n=1 Tax=Streptomyces sp. NPDC002870 TaxID=3364666 RepID=UPI00369D75A7